MWFNIVSAFANMSIGVVQGNWFAGVMGIGSAFVAGALMFIFMYERITGEQYD
jgi:hypothetical protein